MNRLLALTLALSVASADLASGASVASATTVTGPIDSLDPASIPCSTTSLTITSPTRNPFDDYQPPANTPVYSIARVPGVDLRTRQGWEAAQKPQLIDALPPSHSFTNLPVGLYLVAEKGTSNSFYITLPTASADGTSWQCDVHVEPKPTVPSNPPDSTVPPDGLLGLQRIPTSIGATPSETARHDEILGIRRLPVTGASILGLLLLGSMLFGAGLLLVRHRRAS